SLSLPPVTITASSSASPAQYGSVSRWTWPRAGAAPANRTVPVTLPARAAVVSAVSAATTARRSMAASLHHRRARDAEVSHSPRRARRAGGEFRYSPAVPAPAPTAAFRAPAWAGTLEALPPA